MRVVLVELRNHGVRMGDPDTHQILGQVFRNKKAAQAYVAEKKVTADRITFLTREVKE